MNKMSQNEPKPYFTSAEVSHIDKKLGFIVFDWAKHIISYVMERAQSEGVKVLYMNTSDTVHGIETPDKVEYFYEKLPAMMGFVKEKINLRGKPEILWAYHFDTEKTAFQNTLKRVFAKVYVLEDFPSKYQGAVIKILGRKPFYTRDEVAKCLNFMAPKRSDVATKPNLSFIYDIASTHGGGQRWMENINSKPDNVIIQRLHPDTYQMILNDPILAKWWSFITMYPGHFGEKDLNCLGFALVHKYNKNIWVINEVQVDNINKYIDERNKLYKEDYKGGTKVSWNTVKDMLETNNKSNWVPILETNEELKQAIVDDPGLIGDLCDNSVDINTWLKGKGKRMGRLNPDLLKTITEKIASCNFSRRVVLTG